MPPQAARSRKPEEVSLPTPSPPSPSPSPWPWPWPPGPPWPSPEPEPYPYASANAGVSYAALGELHGVIVRRVSAARREAGKKRPDRIRYNLNRLADKGLLRLQEAEALSPLANIGKSDVGRSDLRYIRRIHQTFLADSSTSPLAIVLSGIVMDSILTVVALEQDEGGVESDPAGEDFIGGLEGAVEGSEFGFIGALIGAVIVGGIASAADDDEEDTDD
jgi:hypothetical protein